MGQRRHRVRPLQSPEGGALAHPHRNASEAPPAQADINELRSNGRLFPPNYLHESWTDYLYWTACSIPEPAKRGRKGTDFGVLGGRLYAVRADLHMALRAGAPRGAMSDCMAKP